MLVKRGPVEATGGTTLLRLRLRRRHWCWRWRRGDDWPQRGVRCVDAVEAGEVSLGRRHQRHETADELLGGEGEGDSLLGRVLVPSVSERLEPRLGHGAACAVPCQSLEALPVIAMHSRVSVQREAMRDGDAATSRRGRECQAQRPLQTLELASLVLVLGPRGVGVDEVLLRLPQHPRQNARDVVVRRWRQVHDGATTRPLRLGYQGMQVRRDLKAGAEPLGEDDGTSSQRARHAQAPGLSALPSPHRAHQRHLEALQQHRPLHHQEAQREGKTHRPLAMADMRQQRRDAQARLDGAAVGARGTPAAALAAEGHQPCRLTALPRHLGEAVPHVSTALVRTGFPLHPLRYRVAHARPAVVEGPPHHRRLRYPPPLLAHGEACTPQP